MKRISKKLTMGILTAMMTIMLLTGMVFAEEDLKSGEYTIEVQALNANGEVSTLADAAITKPVKLDVIDGKIYVSLTMKESMADFSTKNDTVDFEKATVVSQDSDAKTVTYKFVVDSIDEPIEAQVNVAAMGRNVNFSLSFDNITMKDIIPTPSVPSENKATVDNTKLSTSTNVNTTTAGKVLNPKTGDNSFSELAIVIAIGVFISFAIYGSNKIKKLKSTVK